MYRLVNQQDGNVSCDINVKDTLAAALEALDYLGYSLHLDQCGGGIVGFPMKLKVVIEVLGGCAEVTSCPENVEVEIIDHDNDRR